MERQQSKLRELMGFMDIGYFNSLSTAKTSLQFVRTMFGLGSKANALEAIFNYLPISETIASSGQPKEEQFPAIKEAGFAHIINLAPHGAENAISNEAELVQNLGMTYVHIPVAFDNPTQDNFSQFCSAMEKAGSDKVYVHCAANMRVSAFLFRYRTEVLAEDPTLAKQDLDKVWKPFGVWAEFISIS